MRATMGPRGVSIMFRHLSFVLGTSPLMREHVAVFGWRRQNTCARCGATFTELYVCGRCKTRRVCSRACQIVDWGLGGHKHWCGEPCEDPKMVEIRDYHAALSPEPFHPLKRALLGPGEEPYSYPDSDPSSAPDGEYGEYGPVSQAAFVCETHPANTCLMRRRVSEQGSHTSYGDLRWDPSYAVDESCDLAFANCNWVFRRAPGVSNSALVLVTTRTVFDGERLCLRQDWMSEVDSGSDGDGDSGSAAA